MTRGVDPEHADRVARLVRNHGAACVRVFGSSMLPWIWPGDVLVIRRTDMRTISPGEVVLFARKGRLFIHRVVRKYAAESEPFLVTKGDAVAHTDGPVLQSEFLGRVALIHRRARQIDLEEPTRLALGRLLSHLSVFSGYWFPVACLVRRSGRLLSKRLAQWAGASRRTA